MPGAKVHFRILCDLFSSNNSHTFFPFHPAVNGSGSDELGLQEIKKESNNKEIK